jgi:hypothetical protein
VLGAFPISAIATKPRKSRMSPLIASTLTAIRSAFAAMRSKSSAFAACRRIRRSCSSSALKPPDSAVSGFEISCARPAAIRLAVARRCSLARTSVDTIVTAPAAAGSSMLSPSATFRTGTITGVMSSSSRIEAPIGHAERHAQQSACRV